MKKISAYLVLLIFGLSFVFADAMEFEQAKKIIDAKTPCSKLTDNQLEMMGDYLMEQMHPGEAHGAMDNMMGGEGSQSLKLMHISIAKRIYCNDADSAADYGFGGMMAGYGRGMMQGIGENYSDSRFRMMGFGRTDYGGMRSMMGYNYGMMGFGYGYWGLLNFLSLALVIGLVILVYLWIIKLWKQVTRKEK